MMKNEIDFTEILKVMELKFLAAKNIDQTQIKRREALRQWEKRKIETGYKRFPIIYSLPTLNPINGSFLIWEKLFMKLPLKTLLEVFRILRRNTVFLNSNGRSYLDM
jgi:hypothetical protein